MLMKERWGNATALLYFVVVLVLPVVVCTRIDATTGGSSTTTTGSTPSRTTTIAFGSCHKNSKSSVPSIWESIVQEGPLLDAFVWTGDAMYPPYKDITTGRKHYGPTSPRTIAMGFEELKVNTTIGYTLLLDKQIPIYGTWDDHDYGGNDMGKNIPNLYERQQIFWEFLGYQPHTHPGVYHSIILNSVHDSNNEKDKDMGKENINLILLDTRSFRDEHCIPSMAHKHPLGNIIACTTRWLTAGLHLWKYSKLWRRQEETCEYAQMLGHDQWEWLETQLLTSTADLNIIVSSVQVWTTNPAMESWGQFPKEQERLWNLLERHYSRRGPKGPVIFLSGDVHHGEVSGQPGFLEVTSSGLTHHCGQPKVYGRLCRPLLENFAEHRFRNDAFYIGLNYGLLQVDWQERVATVHVKNGKGDTVLQVEQPLDVGDFQIPSYHQIPHTWNGHLQPLMIRCVVTLLVILVLSRLWLLRSRTR
jgi:alkaline phosphatase D